MYDKGLKVTIKQDKSEKISARFAPFSKMADGTRANTDIVKFQYAAHTAGNADYAAFVTAADAIEQAKKTLSRDGPRFEKDLDQLYQSYTKILEDMKVDYYVTIKRESWDDRSDYYDPAITAFVRQVSFATFQALTESEREVLKYPDVEAITLVDLDPAMTTLAATHPLLSRLNNHAFDNARVTTLTGPGISPGDFRQIYQASPDRKRKPADPWHMADSRQVAEVRVMNLDADKFLEQVTGFWDVIIVDMPDPSTLELTKLYSKQFYLKVRRRLAKNGIASVQSTSPYLAKESYLCIGRTLTSAGFFILPYHENVPSFGDRGWFLCSRKDWGNAFWQQRIAELEFSVPTRFLTPEVFRCEVAEKFASG